MDLDSKTLELFTSEVFARRYLNVGHSLALVTWAENMVLAGFDSEYINILLGEIAPFNGFEIDELLDRIQSELKLPIISSHSEAIEIIATAYVKRFIYGLADSASTMFKLAELYNHAQHAESIYDFYRLHYAAVDLGMEEFQNHWPDANSNNIERIIKIRCVEWIKEHPLKAWQKCEWQKKDQISLNDC
jgi:hypothetical protein